MLDRHRPDAIESLLERLSRNANLAACMGDDNLAGTPTSRARHQEQAARLESTPHAVRATRCDGLGDIGDSDAKVTTRCDGEGDVGVADIGVTQKNPRRNSDRSFLRFTFQEAIRFDFDKHDVEVRTLAWEQSWERAFQDYNRIQEVDSHLELYLGLLGSTLDLERNIAHTKELFRRMFHAVEDPQGVVDRAPELKTVLGQWAFGHLLADYLGPWAAGPLLAAESRRRSSDHGSRQGSRRRSSAGSNLGFYDFLNSE